MPDFSGSPAKAPLFDSAKGISAPGSRASGVDLGGNIKFFRLGGDKDGPYTHALGAGTGEIDLVALPAGRVIILPDLSRLVTSQFGSSATISLGYRAHTDEDGEAVTAVANALHNAGAAGSGALDTALGAPADGMLELVSQKGIDIYATVASGNIENGDTIDGWLAVVVLDK